MFEIILFYSIFSERCVRNICDVDIPSTLKLKLKLTASVNKKSLTTSTLNIKGEIVDEKSIIALAVAGALTAPLAQADATLYGVAQFRLIDQDEKA
ncbi:hypothetical protein [Aliamphritea spongicola]|nr:hypothetical protein [Aliamphritea spongicola]